MLCSACTRFLLLRNIALYILSDVNLITGVPPTPIPFLFPTPMFSQRQLPVRTQFRDRKLLLWESGRDFRWKVENVLTFFTPATV